MSSLIYNDIKVYGDHDDLENFVKELVMYNKDCEKGRTTQYDFKKHFDELSKVSNDDKDIDEIKNWYSNKDKDCSLKLIGDPIQINSDHISFYLYSYSIINIILHMFVKKYSKLVIKNNSCMSFADYPYEWAYFFEGKNGQYTLEEYWDYDTILWKNDLEFIFEYKEDILNNSFNLTSANVYNRATGKYNRHNEEIFNFKKYDVIHWKNDLSIMIEQIVDYFTDEVKIYKGKIYNYKEISETDAKEMLDFIYKDESFLRMFNA